MTTFTFGGGAGDGGALASTLGGPASSTGALDGGGVAGTTATGAAALDATGADSAPRVGEGCVDEHADIVTRTTARAPKRDMGRDYRAGAGLPSGDPLRSGPMRPRPATPHDADAIRAIYAPIVMSTPTSFEVEVPSAAEIARRIGKSHVWLVAEDDDAVVTGYAYATKHRERPAYQWSVDVSVYVGEGFRARGLGTLLYRELFRLLREKGYVNAYAGIVLPNDASVRLHESLGFGRVGVYRNVGYKLGAWRDVGWWHLALALPPPVPPPPPS